jgi:hypothetical protein
LKALAIEYAVVEAVDHLSIRTGERIEALIIKLFRRITCFSRGWHNHHEIVTNWSKVRHV